MYKIVIVDNEITMISQGRVETSGNLHEFETVAELQSYVAANNLTYAEGVDSSIFDVEAYKLAKIDYISNLAFTLREAILPEYKLVNAGLGI